MMNRMAVALALVSLVSCTAAEPWQRPTDSPLPLVAPDGPSAFWSNLARHCGHAYRGSLTVEPPGDEMLTGTEELIVHFRDCSDTEIRVPFHIEDEATGEWDRSRTWVFMRTAGGLELRHDHRHENGAPAGETCYGGHTRLSGTSERQEFVLSERTAPDGSLLGWRVEVVPDERFTYGTIRGDQWTWRVDFDLSEPVAAPPPPWGHQEARVCNVHP